VPTELHTVSFRHLDETKQAQKQAQKQAKKQAQKQVEMGKRAVDKVFMNL